LDILSPKIQIQIENTILNLKYLLTLLFTIGILGGGWAWVRQQKTALLQILDVCRLVRFANVLFVGGLFFVLM
jgi:hypothetical protein